MPARRGLKATETMGTFYGSRVVAAHKRRHTLPSSGITAAVDSLVLPLNASKREHWDANSTSTEVQVISYGSLAIVALPGEPLIDVSKAILKRSPFTHTLVLGYSNGWGVGYVGMPGEMAKGGYESTRAGGTDESGMFLVETAVRLLTEARTAPTTTPEETPEG